MANRVALASTLVVGIAALQRTTVDTLQVVEDSSSAPQCPGNSCDQLGNYDKQCSGITGWDAGTDMTTIGCTPFLVVTGGSTCEDYCGSQHLGCVRGQDNVGSECTLDARHNRQTTEANGCRQNWNNQVCVCSCPATPAPTPMPPVDCNPAPVTWKLCDAAGNKVKVVSNLGGNGPDFGKPDEVRYVKVAQENGVYVDLVMKVASGSQYAHTFNQKSRGKGAGVEVGCFGWIPVKTNTETKFEFSFVVTGTSSVHALKKFNFAILDLDTQGGFSNDESEYAVLNTPVSQLTRGDDVVKVGDNNGAMRMESSVVGDASDNPAMPLTKQVRRKSFEVAYTNVGVWEVTLGHKHGNPEKDRQFYFYGQTDPQGCGTHASRIIAFSGVGDCRGKTNDRSYDAYYSLGDHSEAECIALLLSLSGVPEVRGATLDSRRICQIRVDDGYDLRHSVPIKAGWDMEVGGTAGEHFWTNGKGQGPITRAKWTTDMSDWRCWGLE